MIPSKISTIYIYIFELGRTDVKVTYNVFLSYVTYFDDVYMANM